MNAVEIEEAVSRLAEHFGFFLRLAVIEEAIQRIRDGSITQMVFDPTTASLVTQT